MERVHEPAARIATGSTYLRGRWCEEVFDQEAPITLELGCGQGMFAVELARRFPGTSVVGVDLKGHRFWRGAGPIGAAERGLPPRSDPVARPLLRREVERRLTFSDRRTGTSAGQSG